MRTTIGLAFLLAAAPAQAEETGFLGARVAATQGRVVLVREGRPLEIVRPGRTVGVEDRAHLEVGAAAQASISWPGVASVRVHGPIALEWGAARDASALELSVLELGCVEIELRAGRARLALPEGWVAWLDAGAFRIEGTARGGFDIENRAGTAVKIGRELAADRVRPAVWLEPGARAPLDAQAEPPRTADLTREAPAWAAVEWPWRDEPAAVVAEVPVPPALPVAVEPPAPRKEFRPQEWRNFSRASLEPHGPIVVERVPALAVKRSPEGRVDVELARTASAPAWILTPTKDVELQPGARVFFDPQGVITARIGSLRTTDLASPRPSWSELAPAQ